MKTCTNCRSIYADDYMGTCTDCGAGMGTQGGQVDSLEARYSAQQREASRVRAVETQVGMKNYGSISKTEPLFLEARQMVMDFRSPEQRQRDETNGV